MKKIMFKDEYGLTEAVLAGRKTMTRRAVPEKLLDAYYDYDDYVCAVVPRDIPCTREYEQEFFLRRSPFEVGENVAVAQRYKDIRDIIGDIQDGKSIKSMAGWRNKMFVSADIMPHQIRITNVRVERLQDISEEDCMKEGIYVTEHHSFGYPPSERQRTFRTAVFERFDAFTTPQNAFAALIDKVSGKGTWESNPWVFVYEFELLE